MHDMLKQDFSFSVRVALWVMCVMVGAPYRKIDFKRDGWFWEYTWSEKQQDRFEGFLTGYLKLSRRARIDFTGSPWTYEGKCRKVAHSFTMNYGWKVKD